MRVFFDIDPLCVPAYSVIMARYGNMWVFSQHKDRATWEIPGGHIEPGESPMQAAKRELWEETGAISFFIQEIGAYGVDHGAEKSYGILFFAQVKSFGEIPRLSEISGRTFTDALPDALTYPAIQPVLFERIKNWLSGNMTTVYFIRHAQPDFSVKDDAARPLTEEGLKSAALLADKLSVIRFDNFYSSPYKRSVDTVKPLANRNRRDISLKDGLRERAVDNVWINDFAAFSQRQWQNHDYKLDAGESLREVQVRNIAALFEILALEKGKTVAIGTHGTALSTILHHFDPSFGFEDFEKLRPVMPYIVRMEFIGNDLIRLDEI